MKTLLQKSIGISLLLFFFCAGLAAQVSGDYRSNATSVTWSTAANWQTYNGTSWVTATVKPGASNSVYIQTGHTVTLTANESCNDLHLESTTNTTRLTLATFTLGVNGKLRAYTATVNTIPGTSTSSPNASTSWITSTTGKLSIVGNTRALTVSGEWGATNIGTTSPNGFDLEINLNSGQTATANTSIKARTFNVVTGTLAVAGGNRLGPDTGAASGSNFTIQSGATVTSDQTGTAGSAVIGRTSGGIGGVLNIVSGGLLQLTGVAPTIGMTTITNSGTVEYALAGTQTLVASTNSGASMSSYTNLIISGSGLKTAALTTSSSSTTTINTGCTLATGAFTFSTTGTVNVNGSFRIDQSGWGGNTGTYNYGTTGTLVFNNTSGSYGVNSTDTWWPTTNGPVNVTVQGGGGVTMNVARTVPSSGTTGTFLLVTGTNAILGTALTLNGITQINGGNFSTTPTYGSSSTLVYNTVYGTSNEWTGGASTTVAAGSGIPANVQVLTGTVTLAGGRGIPGNVTVTAGGLTLNATSGDLYIGGNLTNNGTWTNNSRAVVFVLTGTSVITASAGTQFFDYLLINKSAGSVQAGTSTNITINTTSGSVLQFLNAGTLDLNGRTLTLNNSGGNILLDGTNGGTAKSIISSTGTGTIAVTNSKTTSSTASGTLSTSAAVNWILTGGINYAGATTINGTLQINAGGFVTTNASIYGSGSLLKYNSATNPYSRGMEWSAGSGAGYPYNVQVSNNTNLDPGGTTFTGTTLNLANDLTVDSGSGFYMDYSGHNMTVPLTINRNLILNGGLSASGASGGDVIVKGDWTRTGIFTPNSRAIFFQGTAAQSLTGQTTFDYILIDKTGGSLTLNDNMIVNQTLTFTATDIAKIITGSNNIQITSTGSVNRTGSGYVNGHLQKYIATGSSTKIFEVGDATVYAPVTLAYTGVTTAGTITITTITNDHPQASSSGINTSKSVNRYYSIANSGLAGGTYDATFTFVAGDIDAGATTSNFVVRRYVNPTWFTTTTGTRTSTTTQATGLSAYGDFQIGEPAPLIVATNPASTTVCGGGTATFTSTSSSTPTPTIQWQRGISGVYTDINAVLDGGVYSNFTTTTLSISNVSGLNGYTYRAVFTNINGTATSTAATLSAGITTTYNGSWSPSTPTSLDTAIISANFTATSNISACTLTVNSGAVVDIPSGYNVTLNGSLTVSSGSFTLENNANLVQNTTASNSGSIIVKRNSASIMRQDYTLWSSPVASQNLLSFSPNTLTNRFYNYNPSTDTYVAVSSPSTTNFSVGTGYLIRVANNHPTTPTIWNGQFSGVPNNGNVNLSVSSGTYNAVGNPYPSTMSADSFITSNSLTEALYFWRKTNNPNNTTSPTTSYATYTLAGGAGTAATGTSSIPNGTIQVGQGFIAKATSSSLNFTNSMRTTNNSDQFFRITSENRSRFWLDMKNTDGFASQMMVAYMPDATVGIDAAIDGRYFNDAQTALTSMIDGEEFTIQGRGLPFDTGDVIPLGMKSEAAGIFTISIDTVDGFFETDNTTIYLKDNLLGTTHNLNNSAYEFSTEAGIFNNRFEVVFEDQLSVAQPAFNANQVVVYKQNQNIVINSGTVKMNKVQLYDIRGRLLIERTNVNASEIRLNAGLTNEVLIVKITSDKDEVITKKIVN